MDEVRLLHIEAAKARAAAAHASSAWARSSLEQLAEGYEGEARRLNLLELQPAQPLIRS